MYIKFKWYRFHYFKKGDPTTADALYIDVLDDELRHEIAERSLLEKTSLTLAEKTWEIKLQNRR